jgi:aspartyl aminopeptidase
MSKHVENFIQYIENATSPIQAVTTSIIRLEANGFEALSLSNQWALESEGRYYIRPYPTTLIAFTVGKQAYIKDGFKVITSHTDCPTFKIKPNPEVEVKGYLKLNTEVYGGPILNSWYDRPISLSGQVMLKSDEIYAPQIIEIDLKDPLLIIPSLAIHFNREVNKGVLTNPQKDMLPLMQMVEKDFETKNHLLNVLANKIGCQVEEILDFDLYLYVVEQGQVVGLNKEFISSPRIDNLAMVYSSIEALIDSKHDDGINMAACFDNEEIGSTTKQGADSTLLQQVIDRIGIALHKEPVQLYQMMTKSFMISADGAHAAHPNAMESNDITNYPVVNNGVTIKVSAKQSYATDGISSAIFQQLCQKAQVPYQMFVNRSDVPGGKTLGPIATKYLPIKAVDIGVPMLSMHATRELMGVSDFEDTIKVFKIFYKNDV